MACNNDEWDKEKSDMTFDNFDDKEATIATIGTTSSSLYDPVQLEQLLNACSEGNFATVRDISAGEMQYARQQDPATGRSPLMECCRGGHIDIVQYLVEDCGAPWNAVDRAGKCAGTHATECEHWHIVNYLVDWATRCELILSVLARIERPAPDGESSTKPDYLLQRLQYTEDGQSLLDEDRDAVMMEWERPIMQAHAQLLMTDTDSQPHQQQEQLDQTDETANTTNNPSTSKTVLNIGFGMGIIDTAFQQYGPLQHIIIEAHPDVYRHMIQNQWHTKPNVRICFGTWQDVMPQLIQENLQVDAIFYDTYGEHFLDLEDFHALMVQLLSKPNGLYSFFNGLAPDNLFFHGVACQCVLLQLQQLGLTGEFIPCEISPPNDNAIWEGIRRKYWHGRDIYYLPLFRWKGEQHQLQEQQSDDPSAQTLTAVILENNSATTMDDATRTLEAVYGIDLINKVRKQKAMHEISSSLSSSFTNPEKRQKRL